MLDRLEDKKLKIKEEFEKFEIEPVIELESRLQTTARNPKSRTQRFEERKDKRTKKVNGASLVFLLRGDEIYEDVQTMRRVQGLIRIYLNLGTKGSESIKTCIKFDNQLCNTLCKL